MAIDSLLIENFRWPSRTIFVFWHNTNNHSFSFSNIFYNPIFKITEFAAIAMRRLRKHLVHAAFATQLLSNGVSRVIARASNAYDSRPGTLVAACPGIQIF
jgi:site-specific recombinase XerD